LTVGSWIPPEQPMDWRWLGLNFKLPSIINVETNFLPHID
jgi:hypothetical protein